MIRGFDISEQNVPPDFDHVPDEVFRAAVDVGCKFVYVRASWGMGHEDEQFRYNVARAHAFGLKVGAYHYDYGLNAEDAAEQAKLCRKIIEDAGVLLELPVFYDMEDADRWKARHMFDFTAENITSMCRAWLDNINLNSGVYASYSWLTNYIDWQSLNCPIWNAQWDESDDLGGFVWQDTDQFWLSSYAFDGDYMYDESLF